MITPEYLHARFVELTQTEYDALTTDTLVQGWLYFCTDTGRLYKDGVIFGDGLDWEIVEELPDTPNTRKLYIIKKENQVDTWVAYKGEEGYKWIHTSSAAEPPKKLGEVSEDTATFPTEHDTTLHTPLVNGDWVVVAEDAEVDPPFKVYYGPDQTKDYVEFSEVGQKAVYNDDLKKWALKKDEGILKLKIDGTEVEQDDRVVDIKINKQTLIYPESATQDRLTVNIQDNQPIKTGIEGSKEGLYLDIDEATGLKYDANDEREYELYINTVTEGEVAHQLQYDETTAYSDDQILTANAIQSNFLKKEIHIATIEGVGNPIEHKIYIETKSDTSNWHSSYIWKPQEGETPGQWVLIGETNTYPTYLGEVGQHAEGEIPKFPVAPSGEKLIPGSWVSVTTDREHYPLPITVEGVTFNFADEIAYYDGDENEPWKKSYSVAVKKVKINNTEAGSVEDNTWKLDTDDSLIYVKNDNEDNLKVNFDEQSPVKLIDNKVNLAIDETSNKQVLEIKDFGSNEFKLALRTAFTGEYETKLKGSTSDELIPTAGLVWEALEKRLYNEIVVTALPTENIEYHTIYIVKDELNGYEAHIRIEDDQGDYWTLVGQEVIPAIKVCEVSNDSTLPTIRPSGAKLVVGDWICSSTTATYPLEINPLTFVESEQKAIWNGTSWDLMPPIGVKTISIEDVDFKQDPQTRNINIDLDETTGLLVDTTGNDPKIAINTIEYIPEHEESGVTIPETRLDDTAKNNEIPTALLTYKELLRKLNKEEFFDGTAKPDPDPTTYNEHTIYILNKGNDKYESYILRDMGTGDPHIANWKWIPIGTTVDQPTKVGEVGKGDTFPTTRPEAKGGGNLVTGDYVVSIAKGEEPQFPFTIEYGEEPKKSVTFTEAGQKATYNADTKEWTLEVTDGIKKVKVDGTELEIDTLDKSVDLLIEDKTLKFSKEGSETVEHLRVIYNEDKGLTTGSKVVEGKTIQTGLQVKYTEMTQAEWDELTTEKKQTSGFVKITDHDYSAEALYLHVVSLTLKTAGGDDWGHAHLNVIKPGNTSFTIDTFRAWLQGRGEYSMTGKGKSGSTYSIALVAIGYANATTTTNPVQVFEAPGTYYTRSISTITDTVTPLI